MNCCWILTSSSGLSEWRDKRVNAIQKKIEKLTKGVYDARLYNMEKALRKLAGPTSIMYNVNLLRSCHLRENRMFTISHDSRPPHTPTDSTARGRKTRRGDTGEMNETEDTRREGEENNRLQDSRETRET